MEKPTPFTDILKHYQKADPKIYAVLQNIEINEWFNPWVEFRNTDFFTSLCRSIIGQQLSVKVASTINKRFLSLFPEMRPAPEFLLTIPDEKLREIGLSWSKVKYIKDLASNVVNGKIDLNALENMEDSEITSQLTQIKGIGVWTVEMFLIFTLARENIFSFGDLGLKKGLERIYAIQNPTREQMEEIVNKWHPYKTYASIALWHSII